MTNLLLGIVCLCVGLWLLARRDSLMVTGLGVVNLIVAVLNLWQFAGGA